MRITLKVHPQPAAPTDPIAADDRFDLYTPIHKALRLCMTEALIQVNRVDVDDADELRTVLAGIESLLGLMRSHIRHENDFVHPLIEACVPGGFQCIADEHEEHGLAINGIADEVDELRAAGQAQRGMLALRLYHHLALFVAKNMAHMHIEETMHNRVLWSSYSDAELRAVRDRIECSIPPEEEVTWLRWTTRSANPKDLTSMVGAAKKEPAPEIFASPFVRVQAQLDEGRGSRLLRSLRPPPVPDLLLIR